MTNSRSVTSDVLLLYDNFNKKAALITEENNKSIKRLYYFPTNELIQQVGDIARRPSACQVSKINETDDLFFSLISAMGTLNQPNDVFHFNASQFSIEKLNPTSIRSIPVDHFQSCQTYKGAQFLIDFYFTSKDFSLPVTDDPFYKQVLIQMNIKGTVQGQLFDNVYSFYEFRTRIENGADLFALPEGVSCDGLFNRPKLPLVPGEFSFYEQAGPIFSRVFYSSATRAVRYDIPRIQADSSRAFANILDLNSGVVYSISKDDANCYFSPISLQNSLNLYTKYVSTEYGPMIELTPPGEVFFLQDSFYGGQRLERGLLCDVYVSNKKLADGRKKYIETYMRFNSSDSEVPVAVHVTDVGDDGQSYVGHVFNFNARFDATFGGEFSLEQCFQGKEKIAYGMRFTYAEDVFAMETREEFERNHQLIALFNQVVYRALEGEEVSPVRLIRPRVLGDDAGFTVLAGVTETAPAISK